MNQPFVPNPTDIDDAEDDDAPEQSDVPEPPVNGDPLAVEPAADGQ